MVQPPSDIRPDARLPRHVAIIMDGNGRWAQQRSLPRLAGHRAGTENLRRVIDAFGQRGVSYLTFYAFSTENWTRPRVEVRGLLRILGERINAEMAALHERNVRLRHIGSLEGLPPNLSRSVVAAIELTKDNTGMTVCFAFNYGGRAEIVAAARRIVADGTPESTITEALFTRYLYTAEMPDPDLVIRTASEQRLSNFLIWQTAYSEFYSTPVLWPDFGPDDVDQALAAYGKRLRRFGGLPD